MFGIPQRLRETTRRQKRAALIWMAALIVLDQLWLRIITHYPSADPAHSVQIGLRQAVFYTGVPQATVHAILLMLCVIGTFIILWRTDHQPDIA
jgi:hypothetical protein